MAITLNVGQSETLGIAFLDQNGQPMATPPVLDAAPSWSNISSSVESSTPSTDGATDALVALATGTDTVSLSLSSGGKTFTATLDVTVAAPAQTLTSIAIVPGTATP